jgi:hypothetical protein
LNGRVSIELMEAKLGSAGDQLPRLLHVPTFGNSEVHAPLQIADLICSAIAWPMAAHRSREALAGSPHLHPVADESTWRRFRQRLLEMMPNGEGVFSAGDAARLDGGHNAMSLRHLLC